MLWRTYAFGRGPSTRDLWDWEFHDREIRLLYVAGSGFDTRAQVVMQELIGGLHSSQANLKQAQLLLVGLSGYQLSDELKTQTDENALALSSIFKPLGPSSEIALSLSKGGDDEVNTTNALRQAVATVLKELPGKTDVILDVSSLPRVVYLSLLTGILGRLVPNRNGNSPLTESGINFQVLVAEDAELDAQIHSEDPSGDLITIPGFAGALHAESVQDWPLVWFPILGENRLGQLEKIAATVIPSDAEVCPVVPHPSKDLRRADKLLMEYKGPLFDQRHTPLSNILYVHEAHPFEAYRQLLEAMRRYRTSLEVLGGCRLVITPLASKLITLGAGLACFEMKPDGASANYGVAIPYAEPTRYRVPTAAFKRAKPEVSVLVLAGNAYKP